MTDQSWVKEFPAVVSVCDTQGIMLAMNDRSVAHFADRGGEKLIGSNLFDCHPEPARSMFKQLMETQQQNSVVIERNGKKWLFYQAPWYQNGQFSGFVEVGFEIPEEVIGQ